jgi:transcriptional regulator with GAF, ATPase, and Fis domain
MTSAELRDLERSNIQAALKACNGKVFGANGAAALLDIKPTTLASRIKALGLAPVRATVKMVG